MKLSYQDQSDEVQSVMKNKQGNNMTDCIIAVYAKMKLSCHDRLD